MTSETVQAAQQLLAERERVGLAKYGTTVDRKDLRPGDWLKHAIEEASDLLLYLISLQRELGGRTPDSELPTLSSFAGAAPDAMTIEDHAARAARWANAPAAATHLAQDANGSCWFFYGKPVLECDAWFEQSGWLRAGHNILGRVACEPRPQAAVDPERAAYLKRWEAAPEWAQFVAEDDDGQAEWFERKPRNHIVLGWHVEQGRMQAAPTSILGSVRCEPRPEVQP